jgi:hypothetical protein
MVIWMMLCTIVQNRNGNLNVPYLIENGGEVVVNWNWLDNDWNANNPALRFATLFLLPLFYMRGVLFCQLPMPTAELSTSFCQWFR